MKAAYRDSRPCKKRPPVPASLFIYQPYGRKVIYSFYIVPISISVL